MSTPEIKLADVFANADLYKVYCATYAEVKNTKVTKTDDTKVTPEELKAEKNKVTVPAGVLGEVGKTITFDAKADSNFFVRWIRQIADFFCKLSSSYIENRDITLSRMNQQSEVTAAFAKAQEARNPKPAATVTEPATPTEPVTPPPAPTTPAPDQPVTPPVTQPAPTDEEVAAKKQAAIDAAQKVFNDATNEAQNLSTARGDAEIEFGKLVKNPNRKGLKEAVKNADQAHKDAEVKAAEAKTAFETADKAHNDLANDHADKGDAKNKADQAKAAQDVADQAVVAAKEALVKANEELAKEPQTSGYKEAKAAFALAKKADEDAQAKVAAAQAALTEAQAL